MKNSQIKKIIEGYAVSVSKRRKKDKLEKGEEEEEEKGRIAILAQQIVDMVSEAEGEMKKEEEHRDTKLIGVVAGQLVQLLFAARASSLGALDCPEKYIKFDKQGGLEFVFLHIKGWRNNEQKSTGRKIPFTRRGRDAVPLGVGRSLSDAKNGSLAFIIALKIVS